MVTMTNVLHTFAFEISTLLFHHEPSTRQLLECPFIVEFLFIIAKTNAVFLARVSILSPYVENRNWFTFAFVTFIYGCSATKLFIYLLTFRAVKL